MVQAALAVRAQLSDPAVEAGLARCRPGPPRGVTARLDGARAVVRLQYTADELHVSVTDDGPGTSPGEGTGHGLIGIRERVAVVGGSVQAGPRNGGGFTVEASLPYFVEVS